MESKLAKKRAKKLWTLWLGTYIAFWGITGTYNVYIMSTTGESLVSMLSGLQLLTLLMAAFYFLPLIIVVRHYAKLAQIKWMTGCATILSIILSIWTVFSVIATVLSFQTA